LLSEKDSRSSTTGCRVSGVREMTSECYNGPERRQHVRVDRHVPLKITREEEDIVAETVNISRSGAYCRINKRIPLMMKLKIQLLLPLRQGNKSVTKSIHCQGVVVRIEPSLEEGFYNIAIFFNEIARRDAELINDYVDSCIENK
jgi:c-di-GMP-binding flagellar brake protein YcgR